MVLEIDRRTLFPYPVYEQPHSIDYDSRSIVKRIFALTETTRVVTDLAVNLYEKSVDNEGKRFPFSPISVETWNEPRSLVNRFISNEELRIASTTTWLILKRILIGSFDPQKILNEITELSLLSEDVDQWELLRGLVLVKKYAQNENSDHV